MPTAEAHVRTDRPGRYLVQLCRHLEEMGQHGGAHGGADTRPPPVRHVEWSDTYGVVVVTGGRWTMEAAPGELVLRAEAEDGADLRRIQDLVAGRLETIGRRDNLAVDWQETGDNVIGNN